MQRISSFSNGLIKKKFIFDEFINNCTIKSEDLNKICINITNLLFDIDKDIFEVDDLNRTNRGKLINYLIR